MQHPSRTLLYFLFALVSLLSTLFTPARAQDATWLPIVASGFRSAKLPADMFNSEVHASTEVNLYTADNLSDGLVAYYSFDDGTAADQSGNANHGLMYNNPTVTTGVLGQALRFGGFDNRSYVKVPNSTSLSFVDDFTFSLWFRVRDNTSMDGLGRRSQFGAHGFLAKSGDRSGIVMAATRHQDGYWYPWAINGRCCGASGKAINTYYGVEIDDWHMMSVTLGDGMARLFLDGELVAEKTSAEFSLNPTISLRDLFLGITYVPELNGSWWYPFAGDLDEVRIYARKLSAAEIMSLFRQIVPGYSITGRVTGAEDGDHASESVTNPIPGATVSLVRPIGNILSTYTDATGAFSFTVTPSGVYTISISKPMYSFTPATAQITVPQDQNGITFVGALNADFAPVVFIPGIMGSYLRRADSNDDLWPGQILDMDSSSLDYRPGNRRNDILATDVTRKIVFDHWWDMVVYEPLLLKLAEGRTEYNVGSGVIGCTASSSSCNLTHRTTTGCDLKQAKDNPTVFVFGYDWRLSNVESANRLADYIGCIHRFYPGAKVDIVAHSMGGLVARRYILQTTPNHFVRRVITVGTPWLGAPKFIRVLETGDLDEVNWLVSRNALRYLIESFPGAHELLPSATYFEYAQQSSEQKVFVEDGWDFNKNGDVHETYVYTDLVNLVNERYPQGKDCGTPTDPVCLVGANNLAFHSAEGQDNWSEGPKDIDYHYIVGVRRSEDTFAGYVARRIPVRHGGDRPVLVPLTTFGDHTVSFTSALRAPLGQTPEGDNVTFTVIRSSVPSIDKDDNNTEHTGMLHNPAVLDKITQLLAGAQSVQSTAVEALPSVEPAYYLNVFGANVAYVTNSAGKVTGVVSPTLILRDAGEVTVMPSSTENFLAVIPTYGIYTVTFQSGSHPMLIDLVREGDSPPDYAARWQDLEIPPNTAMQLILSPTGVQELRYDSDGDGAADAPVAEPPIIAQGAAAADIEPPTVTFSVRSLRIVNILAEDPAGVKTIYYSFDGSNFALYTAPVQAPISVTVVYAFADDNLANRSDLKTQDIAPAQAASITSAPITTAMVGMLYSYAVQATGVPTPTFSLLTQPAGMTIDASSGLIQWTPNATGDFTVTVQAANAVNPPAQQTFVIHAVAAPQTGGASSFLPLVTR